MVHVTYHGKFPLFSISPTQVIHTTLKLTMGSMSFQIIVLTDGSPKAHILLVHRLSNPTMLGLMWETWKKMKKAGGQVLFPHF